MVAASIRCHGDAVGSSISACVCPLLGVGGWCRLLVGLCASGGCVDSANGVSHTRRQWNRGVAVHAVLCRHDAFGDCGYACDVYVAHSELLYIFNNGHYGGAYVAT